MSGEEGLPSPPPIASPAGRDRRGREFTAGATWTESPFEEHNEQGIGFATETLGWIGGASNPTWVTTDGGASWQVDGFGENVNRFRMLSDTFGHAVGATVYRYGDPDVVGVAASPPLARAFELHPSAPNPFASATRIRFSLSRDAAPRVSIFDVTGRRIRTLGHGTLAAGEHDLAWDGRDRFGRPVPPGVYPYALDVAGERAGGSVVRLR